jgi:uncharacterized protein YceH (UPF0502 family)
VLMRDISRSTAFAPHLGQAGTGFVELMRNSSKRSSHFLHRYSETGMGSQFNVISFLRALAERQGVEPTDEDLEAVVSFLETIMPALEELEELLPADAVP